jgi:prophage regulatory protein
MMKLLSFENLRERGWPYSRPHTWRLIKAGKFPKPKKIGFGRNGKNVWTEEEFSAALQSMLERAA